MDVFSFKTYRAFLRSLLAGKAAARTQAELARAAKCSPSWVTRVLAGDVQLTPDQAFALAADLSLSADEADYFCLLVDAERAATPQLRKRLQDKLARLGQQGRAFQSSVKTDTVLSDQDRTQYYSSWVYAAVHVACMLTKGQTLELLASRFQLQRDPCRSVLADLERMGLVAGQGGRWVATSRSIHLPADHALAAMGHAIWRQRAVEGFSRRERKGLHYSAIHCLSRGDLDVVAQKLKAAVLECRGVIDDSPPEALGILCLDWMEA